MLFKIIGLPTLTRLGWRSCFMTPTILQETLRQISIIKLSAPKTTSEASGLFANPTNYLQGGKAMFLCSFLLFLFFPCAIARRLTQATSEVFLKDHTPNKFLGRHLLFNSLDFELFIAGDLERECLEEVCTYEESREILENIPETDAFWQHYIKGHVNRPSKLDVPALLIGVIAASVAVVIIALLWCCRPNAMRWKIDRSSRARPRRSNASLIIRRLEELSMQPVRLQQDELPPDSSGLPTYEEAVANSGPQDVPPPPYPGSKPGTFQR